jgi:hypothetical protein
MTSTAEQGIRATTSDRPALMRSDAHSPRLTLSQAQGESGMNAGNRGSTSPASSTTGRRHLLLALAGCASALACGSTTAIHTGGHDGGDTASSVDGPSGIEDGAVGPVDGPPDAQACGTRVPADHRVMEGPPCPSDRGPGGALLVTVQEAADAAECAEAARASSEGRFAGGREMNRMS